MHDEVSDSENSSMLWLLFRCSFGQDEIELDPCGRTSFDGAIKSHRRIGNGYIQLPNWAR